MIANPSGNREFLIHGTGADDRERRVPQMMSRGPHHDVRGMVEPWGGAGHRLWPARSDSNRTGSGRVIRHDSRVSAAHPYGQVSWGRPPGGGCVPGRSSESSVVVDHVLGGVGVCAIDRIDPTQPQFTDEAVLMRTPLILDPALCLRRMGSYVGDTKILEHESQMGRILGPLEFLFERPVGIVPDQGSSAIPIDGGWQAVPSEYAGQDGRESVQISVARKWSASRAPVASSTAPCRHILGPRPSSQSWRLPSTWTNVPSLASLSRRERCWRGRRRREVGSPISVLI